MKTRVFNKEVLYADEHMVKISSRDIEKMKDKLRSKECDRIRLCVHRDIENLIHEMFIIHAKNTYVRPHKHLNKAESLHIIDGSATVAIFDDSGNIIEVIPMGDYSSGQKFYYRIADPYYHTLVINSDFLVFHETTQGPFRKSETLFAPWTPAGSNSSVCMEFNEHLVRKIDEFGRCSNGK